MELQPLLAFGGNDRASRSARAKLQWRDRYGKFIEMGRGIKFKVRLPHSPAPVSVLGKFVGATDNPSYGQVYVTGNTAGVPDGFYTVQSSNAAETIANLSTDQLARSGITPGKDVNGNLISSRTDKDVQSFADLHYSKTPLGWTAQKDGSIGTADGSFKVKDGGGTNGYALYHNNSFVGYYNKNDWDQILTKANNLDSQEEGADAAAAAPAPKIDHHAAAEDALAPVDKSGEATKMLRKGAKPEDVLTHLEKNSPEYQALRAQAGNQGRIGYRGPVQKQAQHKLNDIQAKLHASHDRRNEQKAELAKSGLISRGKSSDGIEIPTAPNKTNDTTLYAVEREGGQIGRPATVAQLNRTEFDIYNARKEIARREKLISSAEIAVNGPGRLDNASPAVAARRKAAAQKGLDEQHAALREAQANLDKLEKAAGLQQKDAPVANNDSNTNVVDAVAEKAPESPALAATEAGTPLVTNDDTTLANVSAPLRLDPAPHTPKNNLPQGTTDDPKQIAQEFNKVDLQNALTEAIASGDADVRLQFPNGTAATVPTEAVRDAVQHQGHNTNVDVNPDPQITTQEALDALPAGSRVQRGTITLTKGTDGTWTSQRGAVYQNLMQTSADNNLKLTLMDNAGDKNAPSVATPVTKTDAAPAPKDGPSFKSTKDLKRGDEVANGTILNVFKQTSTPKGKSEVRYLDNRGNIRSGQWHDGTQIGIVKRPARPLPGDTTPTPTPNTPAPSTPTPSTPAAPNAPSRDALPTNLAPRPRPGAYVEVPGDMKRGGFAPRQPLKDFQVKALKDGDAVYYYGKASPKLSARFEAQLAIKKGDSFISSDGQTLSTAEMADMAKFTDLGGPTKGVRFAGSGATSLPDGIYVPDTAAHGLAPGDTLTEDAMRKLVPGDRVRFSNPGAMTDYGVAQVDNTGKLVFVNTGKPANNVPDKFAYFIGNVNNPDDPLDGRQDQLKPASAAPATDTPAAPSTPATPKAPAADDSPAAQAARIEALPVTDFTADMESAGRNPRMGPDGKLLLVTKKKDILAGTPEETTPLKYIYRAISEDDYNSILKNGYIKSDGRMNLVSDEGTVATHRDPSWYLPNDTGVRGRIIRIDYDPADNWRVDTDGYLKTDAKIPNSRISGQGAWFTGTGNGHMDLADDGFGQALARGIDNSISNKITDLRNTARAKYDQPTEERFSKLVDDLYKIKTSNRAGLDALPAEQLAKSEDYLKAVQDRLNQEAPFEGDQEIKAEVAKALVTLEAHKSAAAASTPAAPAAPDAAPAVPEAPTPAPGAVQPPVTSTDANGNGVAVPNAPATPTPAAADAAPVTDKALAQHLAKTRINPGGDPFLDMALDDVNNNADPSALAIAYVLSKMKDQPSIAPARTNTPPAPQTPATPATPTPDATPHAPAAPAAPAAPNAQAVPNPTNSLTPTGKDINDPDLVLKAVKDAYPNHQELKNGDLILGSHEVTNAVGARRRYDLVVTRTGNEYFYTYVRETNLTDGTAVSQRFGPMVHSAKALDTRIQVGLNTVNDRKAGTWFNSRARRPFIKTDDVNPATGEREHLKEQPVMDSTISDIHKAVNDNLVSEDLIRSIYDVVSRQGMSKRSLGILATQHNLSSDKMNKIVDAINVHVNAQNAKKSYQTWVSGDGLTPLFEGDTVQHVDGRIGRVTSRIVKHDSKKYGYSDYIFFQEIDPATGRDIGNQRNMTSRKFSIVRTAQGTDGSERIGPNATPLAAPQLSTRAQNKANKQNAMRAARQNAAPPAPNQPVAIDRTNPAAPTVNVNGTTHPVNLSRTHTTQNDTPVTVPADQVKPGDLVQIYDPTTDKNRLGEVAKVTPTDNGTQVTSVVPDDGNANAATVVTTNVPGTGSDSQPVDVLRPAPVSDIATQADFDRLKDAYRAADVGNSSVDSDVVLRALRTLLADVDSKQPKADLDSLIADLAKQPQRGDTSINTNKTLQDTVKVAQAVTDDHPQSTDLSNATDQAVLTADAVSTPSGRVQSIIDENATPTDLSSYTQTSGKKGSNPGGMFKDFAKGDEVYVKFQTSQDRADNEVLASALYRAVGRNAVANIRGTRTGERRPISYSPLMSLDSSKTLRGQMRRKDFSTKVHDGFAIDAWLANWDGTLNDNISVDTNGDPVHMDLGGALRYRAKGQLKPEFGPKVEELKTLVNGRNSSQYAAYGRMSEDDKKRSAQQLLNINDHEIDTLVKEIHSTSMNPADAQKLSDTLKARRKFILDTYGIKDTQVTAPTTGTPTAVDAAPAAPAAPQVNDKGIPIMQGYKVEVDKNGHHFVKGGISSADYKALRQGKLALPALPFKMKDTSSGDVHYYDSSGTRRWGQYGAGGAMIRRQNPDGSYSYLMAQRGATLSTEPNKWSIMTGAHKTEADAADPKQTAIKELGEEVGVKIDDLTHTHDLTVAPDPDWKFTYSFFDLDPAKVAQYENVKIKDPREIQNIGWVPESQVLDMAKQGQLHSSFTPAIVSDIKGLSDQNPFSYQAAAQNTPAAPKGLADGKPIGGSDLADAPVGQVIHVTPTDGNTDPRRQLEYTKAPDGAWFNSSWNGVKRDAGDTLHGDKNQDSTQLLQTLSDNPSNDGRAMLTAGPAKITEPTYTPKNDGDKVDSAWEYASPEGSVMHYDNGSGIRAEYVKDLNNNWALTESSPNLPEAMKPRYVSARVASGDLKVGALPIPDVAAGHEVDASWINKAKPSASISFRSPITHDFTSLVKINKNQWTDGVNVFHNDAVNKLRGKHGGNQIYAGGIPDTATTDPTRGEKLTENDLHAAPVGTVVNMRGYNSYRYTATKQADNRWLLKNVSNPNATSDYYNNSNQPPSQLTYFAAGSIRRGEPLAPLEKEIRQVVKPSPVREALAEHLAQVDPHQHIAAHAPLGFMSDENIRKLQDDIAKVTNNFTTELPTDVAQTLIDKHRPAAPKDIQGWLAISEGLANEVAQLRALAGETDAAHGAKNLEFAHGNYVLAAISTLRGFDAKPQQSGKSSRSSFGPGTVKVYRGVRGYRDRSSKDLLDQLRSGDVHYAGTGVYGNGTYVTTRRATSAGTYSGGRATPDNLITMGLPVSDMKIFEYNEPNTSVWGSSSSKHEKIADEFKDEMRKYLTGRGLQPGTPEYKAAYDRIYNLMTEVTRKGNDRKRGGKIDVGVYAAMLGYDAIRKGKGHTAQRDQSNMGANNVAEEVYYIVLNRGKLIIGKD